MSQITHFDQLFTNCIISSRRYIDSVQQNWSHSVFSEKKGIIKRGPWLNIELYKYSR